MFRSFLIPVVFLTLASSAVAWELKICADPAGQPYSSEDGSGFDNRIAVILAGELGADVRLVWMQDRRSKTALGYLQAGACDVVMGVIDGQRGTLTTHAYYRTTYVFVTLSGKPEVASLDDPALAGMRIGVPGGARRTTPPAIGLTRRGQMRSLMHFGTSGTAGETEAQILRALGAGDIDVAILWGPVTAQVADSSFVVRPVVPEVDMPFLPMSAAFSVGVRPHDESLRDAIDHALAARWMEVQAVLRDAKVPLLNLPQPVVAGASQ